MAPRRARSGQSRLDLDAVTVVGAILTPEIVSRVAALNAPETTPEDYGIPPGLRLRDEIARAFKIGEALWDHFEAADATTASETFALRLLKECFGFDTLAPRKPVTIGERVFPIRHAALGGRVPVVIAPAPSAGEGREGIDQLSEAFGDGARRRTATTLLQEHLNAHDAALWGLATDGVKLRLLRDNASLTRSAWVEVDLRRIFTEGLFPDFSALWLLIHQSRFGGPDVLPGDCPLERWREKGREEGVAARDKLRDGVEAALKELGDGFLAHPDNHGLRQDLVEGRLTAQGYFEELLKFVYRLIFLFAAEDRKLLHPPETSADAQRLYARGYGVGRLRERCIRSTAWDRHIDVWEGLKTTFRLLSAGEPALGLPALGGLFAPGQSPHLRAAKLENRRILRAIWCLAWFRPDGRNLTRVNWRDMETEELGSVYESLLELTPRVLPDARGFDFEGGVGGHARKTTGSYYTPEPLVKLVLDTTLEPVLDAAEARNPANPAAEILRLSIIDPACGSGHFLLGAARRAAIRIARHRSGGAPSLEQQQRALREVVSRCIYGVDRNPMAVDLCKVALWIEAIEPGKPLSFLDARIRCGDSLIGVFDYDMLRKGLPDAAFKALTGDDGEVAKAYRRFNKQQREGRGATGFIREIGPPEGLVDDARRILAMPEETLEEIEAKAEAFERLHSGENWLSLKAACDMYVAAFFLPKIGEVPEAHELRDAPVPTTETVWRSAGGEKLHGRRFAEAMATAEDNGAFHWPIEFPQVMAFGGFDAVIGNPPWEVSQLSEVEYFAARDPEIAALAGDRRKRAIARLEEERPELWRDFVADKRRFDATNELCRASGRFDLSAVGKINTYALFTELFSNLARRPKKAEPASLTQVIADTGGVRQPPSGRAGVIVQTGIATDSSTAAFFGNLVDSRRLSTLIDFENRKGIFPAVDSRQKFCVLAIGPAKEAELAFFLTDAVMLENPERRFFLSPEQIARINPNTKTAPVFRSRADAELTAKLYDRAPVLIEERPAEEGGDVNPWGITFQQGLFNMTSASEHFATAATLIREGWERDGADWVKDGDRRVPLYEAKMIHHFDHRWATYEGEEEDTGARDLTLAEKQNPAFEPSPRYWVPEEEVQVRAARVPARLKTVWRKGDGDKCLALMAEWTFGALAADGMETTRDHAAIEAELRSTLGNRALSRPVLGAVFSTWLGRAATGGAEMQAVTPLTPEDRRRLAESRDDPLDLTWALMLEKQPRWLMGWRDICRSTDERTVVGGMLPMTGVGNNLPLWHPNPLLTARQVAALVGILSSLAFDFVARHKVGGTHLNFFIAEQLPALPPEAFSDDDLAFVAPRVLELTYTSHAMGPWAEDLGHAGPPFAWDEDRRARLRAELDAFFALKYGLTRDELRYVLDPADARGPDYPSETFRVLKSNETARFGEYRTRRLVLEAFDRMTGTAAMTGTAE